MSTLVVVSDPDTALGFRLAGAVVEEVESARDGAARVLSWLERRQAGVVMYHEGFRAHLTEAQTAALDESLTPVFFALPVERAGSAGEARREYLARLVRRAIGFQLNLKRD